MSRRRVKATWLTPLVVTALLAAVVCGCKAEAGGEDDSQTVGIRFSRFEPGILTIRAGEAVEIVIDNRDPIAHEWIVGSTEVHERHRTGTEPYHDQVPTEVTVPAFSSRTTMVRFDQPGDYPFICHLPGHEAYGMIGILRVEP